MQYLKVLRFTSNGAYLVDDNNFEVLLPNRYLDNDVEIGKLVWVFVYTDSSDRFVAITDVPKAFKNDITTLEVVSIANNGVYLDLGILKDIFLPSKNPSIFKIGQKVVVKILLDKQQRLIARQNIADHLIKAQVDSKIKDVDILPFLRTDIGFNCIVNNKYFGIIHNNDINKNITIGIPLKGIVKQIRSDGKIDLGIMSNIDDVENIILDKLKLNNKINLDFKSNPDEVFKILGISKKSFKITINRLIKENKVEFIKDSLNNFILVLKKS